MGSFARSPQKQFEVLHSKFPTASRETRAILLSSYVKFVNLFPEIKDLAMGVCGIARDIYGIFAL